MDQNTNYTLDECKRIVIESGGLSKLRSLHPDAYQTICDNHWNKEFYYGHIKQHREQQPEGDTVTFTGRSLKRSLEDCMSIALQYEYKGDFISEHNDIYAYIKLHGWKEQCMAHMISKRPCTRSNYKKREGKYTLEYCKSVCSGYDTIRDLETENKKILSYVRNHGWQSDCLTHLKGYRGNKSAEHTLMPIDGEKQLLTYKFRIDKRDDLTALMRISKDLYNQSLYVYKKSLEEDNVRLSFIDLRHKAMTLTNLDGNINYRLMPNVRLADMTLQQLVSDIRNSRSKLPSFLPKDGLNKIKIDDHASTIVNDRVTIARGITIQIPNFNHHKQSLMRYTGVSIVPRKYFYEVCITYESSVPSPQYDRERVASIDLGIDNLITMVTPDETIIHHGRFLKSYNNEYNNKMKQLKALPGRGKEKRKRMTMLNVNRNAYISDCFHKISRKIVSYLETEDIGRLIIGYSKLWKQRCNFDKKNQIMFQRIPFLRLINMIEYKCKMAGIETIIQEESYTSKCDALALEPVERHDTYLGRRIHRGLFISSTGCTINADVNGAINIMRKAVGDTDLVRQIISSGHLYCPVGFKNPF